MKKFLVKVGAQHYMTTAPSSCDAVLDALALFPDATYVFARALGV